MTAKKAPASVKATLRTAPVAAPKVAKVTKTALVRAEFDKGASLSEAAKTTGVDPAFVWDIAAKWEKDTGKRVPRNADRKAQATAKVAKTAAPKARAPKKATATK